jgi:short-subunit dehydrogenase
MKNLKTLLPQDLKRKNILITGGTTGIGRATAMMLAGLGANIMITGRHRNELNDAIKDMSGVKAAGALVTGVTADVTKENAIKKIFAKFDSDFGEIDVLINNAAIAFQSVLDGSHKDRSYALDTNVSGYFACTHEAAVRMKQRSSGHIINVGSMSADVREQDSSVYVATKAAIQGFSEALRKELNPHHIKITLIEPGATATNMQGNDAEALKKKVKKEEMLDADDVAAAIVYSLSQPQRCNVAVVQVKPLLQII